MRRTFGNVISYFLPKRRDIRYIFSINSGRAGSGYLAELLGTAERATAFHEAEPTMTGAYLDMINKRPYQETFRLRRIKEHAIRKISRTLPPGGIYCETNHMFIKTFFDVIVRGFDNVELVILRRDLSHVLKSFIELGYFSPKNTAWPDWMSSPNAVTAALPCIGTDSVLDQYDLCVGYLFDIEARTLRFQREYPQVRTHEVRIEDLSNYANVEALFSALRIVPTSATRELTGQRINARSKSKKGYDNPADLSYCRDRIVRYQKLASEKGIVLPATAALSSIP
ncbi:MAG: hypothetical protein FIA94_09740 [Nitrospirae bacterium]|nr:hypothetical protein [Nitrospirota bacterium]